MARNQWLFARKHGARRGRMRRGGILDLCSPGPARRCGSTSSATRSNRSAPSIPNRSARLSVALARPRADQRGAARPPNSMSRFRQAYVAEFGAHAPSDALYAAVSEGRRASALSTGCRCSTTISTLFSTMSAAPRSFSTRASRRLRRSAWRRSTTPTTRARAAYLEAPGRADYKPLPPDRLYLSEEEWKERLGGATVARLTPLEGSAERKTSSTAAAMSAAISPPSGTTRTPTSSTPRSAISRRFADGPTSSSPPGATARASV